MWLLLCFALFPIPWSWIIHNTGKLEFFCPTPEAKLQSETNIKHIGMYTMWRRRRKTSILIWLTTKRCGGDFVDAWNGGNLSMSLLKSGFLWYFCAQPPGNGVQTERRFPSISPHYFLDESNLLFKTMPTLSRWRQKMPHFTHSEFWARWRSKTASMLIWWTYSKRHVQLYHVCYTES